MIYFFHSYLFLGISGEPSTAKSGTGKDEFDMFAQSRNVTYESSKLGYDKTFIY